MVTEDILIDVKELSAWLTLKKPVTVLDIRPLKEREEWLIPGSVHADVYDKLKAGATDALDGIDLPSSDPVVTVCAGGKLSVTAAELLRRRGHSAFSLRGGMKAWNYAWNLAELDFSDAKVIQVRRSAKGCLSYIIGADGEAMVIDASLDPGVYEEIAGAQGWRIKYVADTHVHADYVSRTRELAAVVSARHVMYEAATVEYPFAPVADGETLTLGNTTLEVMHTPGHTWESTSFRLGNVAVFTGDTLFVDGVGRPDLKADETEAIKKSKALYNSLQQLLKLPGDTVVFPAHFSSVIPFDRRPIASKINDLREQLTMLRLPEEDFTAFTLSRIPPAPANYLAIAALNKSGSYAGFSLSELEVGANRCAIG